jgi:Leucine-rich repeat (LRR) protein
MEKIVTLWRKHVLMNSKNSNIMKKLLLLNLLLAMFFGATSLRAAEDDVVFNSTNFPDDAFRQYLHETYPFYEGETLTQKDLDKVKTLNLTDKGISSLKGVEHFRYLENLYCDYNNLTTLDLSRNKILITINCSHNILTSLTLPVDPRECLKINCSHNKLTSLEVSVYNPVFGTFLDCSHNNLTSIKISHRGNDPQPVALNCSYNNLSSLNYDDIDAQLYKLNCSHNNFTQLEDLWRWTWLRELDCSYNKLNGNLPLAAGLTLLEDLNCSGNDFTYINLQNLTGLKRFTMTDSKITSLDLTNNTLLHYLKLNYSKFDELRLLKNTELDTVIVNHCDLNKLLFTSAATNLMHLECKYNSLTSLWLYDQPNMKYLDCSNNQLTTLNYNSMPQLETFDCSYNEFDFLDISKLTNLKKFYAHHNKLISIAGVEYVDGPTWINYDANAFTPQEPTTRRFERIDYNGGKAWALYLGMNDASRILNYKKDDVSATPVLYKKYLIISEDLSQIPSKVEYDFKPFVTKNAFNVVVNYDVKNYNILIDGKQMTSLDMYNVPGVVSGKAYFEDEPDGLGWSNYPTLVLDNATLEWDGTNYGIYNNNNYYFTIKVIGDCSVTSKNYVALELDPVTSTTIEGGGTLNILSKYSCIESFVLTELTIQDNTKIIGRSTDGIGYYEGDVAKLEIKDGAVFAVNSKYEPLSLDRNLPVFGEGIDIRYPEGAYFGDYNNLYYADGTKVQNDWAVIGPKNPTGLGFSINGKTMTRLDARDVLDDVPGVVSGEAYIEVNKDEEPTLVLDNATLEWKTLFGMNCFSLSLNKIRVLGDCTIKDPNGVALVQNPKAQTTIEGGGTLHVFSPIVMNNSRLSIQDNTTIIAESEIMEYGLSGSGGAKLEITNGGTIATYGIFMEECEFALDEGTALRYPFGAYIGSDNIIYNADGTKVKDDWIVIGPDNEKTKDLITGVHEIDNSQQTTDNSPIYNIAGQRLNKMQKGLNILNGKKILR